VSIAWLNLLLIIERCSALCAYASYTYALLIFTSSWTFRDKSK